MKIKYEFLKGQVVEVEVSDEIGAVIVQIEKDTANSDRRETRRHVSFEEWTEKTDTLADPEADVEREVMNRDDAAALHRAIARLKPDEQDLLRRVYLDKHPMTQAEYARQLGITENAVQLRAASIRKKLRKLIK